MSRRARDGGLVVAAAFATLLAASAHAGDGAWTAHSPPGVSVHALTATAAQPGRLYAAGRGSGVHRSDDGGDTWIAVNEGLDNLDISALAASPLDADLVVAAQVDGALQVSTDGGASWSAGGGSAVGTVSTIAFDPRDDRVVFALDGDAVLRSTDRGLTWQRAALGTTLNALAFAPDQPAVYLGTDAGLFESADGGDTWTDVAGPDVFGGWWFGDSRIVALAANAEAFSVIGLAAEVTGVHAFRMPGGSGGRLVSRDAVRAAEHIAFDLTSADPHLARALLAGPHGIHGSVDAGAMDSMETGFYGGANHWLPLAAGLPRADADGYAVTALLFDPSTARRYFAVVDGAVMRYDGKIGADLRLGGRQVDGFENPALMSPICCEDTPDGGKQLTLQFTLLNRSAETATDVEFRIAVEPPVPLSASIRDGSAAFECSEVSPAETVCAVDEMPRSGWAEGIATVLAHEAGDYQVTATLTAAERDPTPGTNAATQRFAPAFPADAPLDDGEPVADEPVADEPAADEPDTGAEDETAAPDSAPSSNPPSATPSDATGTGGGGSWNWWSFAALALLVVRRRRRAFRFDSAPPA